MGLSEEAFARLYPHSLWELRSTTIANDSFIIFDVPNPHFLFRNGFKNPIPVIGPFDLELCQESPDTIEELT